MLETGVATREDIDQAMKLGCGYPMGPFTLRPGRPGHHAVRRRGDVRRVPGGALRAAAPPQAHGDGRASRPEVRQGFLRLLEDDEDRCRNTRAPSSCRTAKGLCSAPSGGPKAEGRQTVAASAGGHRGGLPRPPRRSHGDGRASRPEVRQGLLRLREDVVMALRTPQQYLDSLRDGRTVYYRGEPVADVTAHPELGVETATPPWSTPAPRTPPTPTSRRSPTRPAGSPAGTGSSPRAPTTCCGGTRSSTMAPAWGTASSSSSRRSARTSCSPTPSSATRCRRSLKAPYHERLKAYRRHVEQHDLALAVAQTDVKGDRSLGPSEQEHPDYYLRVVDRQKDGIVVRGAKAHTTRTRSRRTR